MILHLKSCRILFLLLPRGSKRKRNQTNGRREQPEFVSDAEVANVNKEDGLAAIEISKSSKQQKGQRKQEKEGNNAAKRARISTQNKKETNEAAERKALQNSQLEANSESSDGEAAIITDEENGVQITVTKGNESYCQSDYDEEEGELLNYGEDMNAEEVSQSQSSSTTEREAQFASPVSDGEQDSQHGEGHNADRVNKARCLGGMSSKTAVGTHLRAVPIQDQMREVNDEMSKKLKELQKLIAGKDGMDKTAAALNDCIEAHRKQRAKVGNAAKG